MAKKLTIVTEGTTPKKETKVLTTKQSKEPTQKKLIKTCVLAPVSIKETLEDKDEKRKKKARIIESVNDKDDEEDAEPRRMTKASTKKKLVKDVDKTKSKRDNTDDDDDDDGRNKKPATRVAKKQKLTPDERKEIAIKDLETRLANIIKEDLSLDTIYKLRVKKMAEPIRVTTMFINAFINERNTLRKTLINEYNTIMNGEEISITVNAGFNRTISDLEDLSSGYSFDRNDIEKELDQVAENLTVELGFTDLRVKKITVVGKQSYKVFIEKCNK